MFFQIEKSFTYIFFLPLCIDYARGDPHQCRSLGQYHDHGLEHNWRESIKMFIDQLGGVY